MDRVQRRDFLIAAGVLLVVPLVASHVAFLMNPRSDSHAAFAAELKTAAWKIGALPLAAGAAINVATEMWSNLDAAIDRRQ